MTIETTRWALRGAVALLVSVLAACGARPDATDPADAATLVLLNGNIVTMDESMPRAEAVAVRGTRIVAIGTSADMQRFVGVQTEVIDLQGRLAVPGFIEGHGHFVGLGNSRMILDLLDVTRWDQVVEMVGEAASGAQPGEWILGRGWHQDKWVPAPLNTVEGVPTHADLSRAAPNNPVLLTHASGHASLVNARTMELAGITRATPDPEGGTIVRDAAGEATGYLRQAAQRLANAARSEAESRQSEEERLTRFRRSVELAGAEALRYGVTTFHDAGSDFQTIDRFRAMADRGELPIRLYVMVRGEPPEVLEQRLSDYRLIEHADNFLTVRSIKMQIDGALGTHGAWLLEPYSDLVSTAGLPQGAPSELRHVGEIAMRHGFQVNTHAIGDRGNRETLDAYEAVFRAKPDRSDHRWRIEHAQHLHPADIPRFASLGVIASMQGNHATSDGPWVPDRVGQERARTGAYVWRALLDAGAVVTNGTDTPVERIDPIASFFASVTRQLPDGNVFFPEQRLTREEALYTYTMANAFSGFHESSLGSISAGKYADIVVLSQDIMTVPDDQIRDTRVVYTILNGRVAYDASAQMP